MPSPDPNSQEQLLAAYRTVFSGPQGRAVLADILKVGGFFRFAPQEESSRFLAQYILSKLPIWDALKEGISSFDPS